MSRATRCTLAWPCLPVLEVDISTILHGRFWQKMHSIQYREHHKATMFTLIMTKPPFLSAEHCMGKVSEAPESPWLKSWSSLSDILPPR